MHQALDMRLALKLQGGCVVTVRDAQTHAVISRQRYTNTLSSAFKAAIVKDLVQDQSLSRPRVMAFSRDVVSNSPFPTALTNEFRSGVATLSADNKYVIACVLGSSEGNDGGGNIRSIGFYYGDSATTVVGTGTLGGLINTLNVAKTSLYEITFQYEITFG